MEGGYILLALMGAGGLGSVIRYVLSHWQGLLPWGILVANTTAGLVAGLGLLLQTNYSAFGIFGALMAFVVTSGFAGGLSTFSSWAAQTSNFLMFGKVRLAMYNTLLNLVLPIAAVILGIFVADALIN